MELLTMEFSIVVILVILGGWLSGKLFSKVGLPNVVGMLFWGICIGVLWISSIPLVLFQLEHFLKTLALIVILLRAGLAIHKRALKDVGKAALLMSFLPCLMEGVVLTFVIMYFFGFEFFIAGLAGFMLAAVSPAIVVPSMLEMKENGSSANEKLSTLILTGSSLDDVLAITMFSIFLAMAAGVETGIRGSLAYIPVSILLGILPGIALGFIMVWLFQNILKKLRATEKIIILLMVCLLLVELGSLLNSAAFLGIILIGFILLHKDEKTAHEMSKKISGLWVLSEIILFVLIGISVDLQVAYSAGLISLLVISIGLLFRAIGVYIATIPSNLTIKERKFCMIAYIPKATVQAALGGIPLAMGITGGKIILAIAALSIVFTAPIGAIGIKIYKKKLL
jgi:solute carrier family 9B (sodium/hydrogen exchanger), member 1/2